MPVSADAFSLTTTPEDFKLSSASFTAYTTSLPTYDQLADTNTPPATDTANGRYVFARPSRRSAAIQFLGKGSDNQTINYLVICWNRVSISTGDPPVTAAQWTPVAMVAGVATLSAKTGVSGGNVLDDTVRYADTITVTVDRSAGPLFTRVMAGVAGDDSAATLLVPIPACHNVEIRLDMGTATSGNVILRGHDE